MCYRAEFGDFALKGCVHKCKRTQKIGLIELGSLGMGGMAEPKIHALLHIYHVGFGSSVTKGVRINKKGTQKLGSVGTPSPWVGSVAAHIRTSPLPINATM